MLPPELVWGQVLEAAVRTYRVVVTAPVFDHDTSLGARAEPLQGQTFIAELPVEALVGTVLPGLARVDQRRLDALGSQPLEDGATDELRAVVRAQVARRPVGADQLGQELDHPLGADGAGHVDRQAFPRELVDDGQAFDLLTVRASVEDEIVGPDEVRARRRKRSRPARGNPAPRTPSRQLQPRFAPQPVGTLPGELVTRATQEDAHAPIAVARILRREPLERLDQRCVLPRHAQDVAQRRARDSDQPTGAPLRQAAFAHERDLLAPRLRAHHFRRLISLSRSMSRSRSASSFLSFAFSASSVFRRLTSAG